MVFSLSKVSNHTGYRSKQIYFERLLIHSVSAAASHRDVPSRQQRFTAKSFRKHQATPNTNALEETRPTFYCSCSRETF